MDPVTIWIFCLASAWFLRRAFEDGAAALRGRESPRIAQRRAKQELAQSGERTIGQAVAGRIADRIADPKPRGPMRQYLADLWEDSWEDARVRHEQRRRARADREQEELDIIDAPDDELRTHLCRGDGCDVLVVEPAKWCDNCLAQMREDQARRAEPESEHVLRTRPCRGGCGVLIVEPQEWCTACSARWTSSTPPAAQQPQPEPQPERRTSCRVCLAHPVATDISGRCEECARGNFGHAHYCTTGCGQPVDERGQTCPACQRRNDAPPAEQAEQEAAASIARLEAMLAAEAEAQRRAEEDYRRRVLREWEQKLAAAQAAGQPTYYCAAHGCGALVHEHGQVCVDCARFEVDNGPAGQGMYRCNAFGCQNPVTERNTGCDACRAKSAAARDEALRQQSTDQTPDTPEPAPAPDTTGKDISPMTTTEIDGDVAGPLQALAFATNCLDLNTAVMNELDVMASNLEAAGVGGGCVQIVRDAWSAADQFGQAAAGARDEYARHVVTQAEIAGNTDLRDTVQGTYLDAARALPQPGSTSPREITSIMTTINGADVHTPREAEDAMNATAQVYGDLLVSIEQSSVNLSGQGVSGDAINMLTAMSDAASILLSATNSAAGRFAEHRQTVGATIAADPSLAGTQDGKYMDPAAL